MVRSSIYYLRFFSFFPPHFWERGVSPLWLTSRALLLFPRCRRGVALSGSSPCPPTPHTPPWQMCERARACVCVCFYVSVCARASWAWEGYVWVCVCMCESGGSQAGIFTDAYLMESGMKGKWQTNIITLAAMHLQPPFTRFPLPDKPMLTVGKLSKGLIFWVQTKAAFS